MPAKDMKGLRFGKLLVLNRASNNKGTARWDCVCDCGQLRCIPGTSLRAGRYKSCGCSSPRFEPKVPQYHGMQKTRVYAIWCGMHHRCSSSATGKTKRLYFDKGIKVCERWHLFENFFSDMGHPPQGHSIDRIDGTKNYEPNNCRWADSKTQANNTSVNHKITVNGITKNLSQWAEETGVKANTILHRIRRGAKPEDAIKITYKPIATLNKMARQRRCAVCENLFTPRPSQIRNGHGLFCSQACNGISRMKLKETSQQRGMI